MNTSGFGPLSLLRCQYSRSRRAWDYALSNCGRAAHRALGEFHRARWLARALLWTQVVDAALFRVMRVDLAVRTGTTVVLDWFALDIIVDIAAAADDESLLDAVPARLLRRLARKSVAVVLDADVGRQKIAVQILSTTRSSKKECRAALYRKLARLANVPTIDANRPIDDVRAALTRAWELKGSLHRAIAARSLRVGCRNRL